MPSRAASRSSATRSWRSCSGAVDGGPARRQGRDRDRRRGGARLRPRGCARAARRRARRARREDGVRARRLRRLRAPRRAPRGRLGRGGVGGARALRTGDRAREQRRRSRGRRDRGDEPRPPRRDARCEPRRALPRHAGGAARDARRGRRLDRERGLDRRARRGGRGRRLRRQQVGAPRLHQVRGTRARPSRHPRECGAPGRRESRDARARDATGAGRAPPRHADRLLGNAAQTPRPRGGARGDRQRDPVPRERRGVLLLGRRLRGGWRVHRRPHRARRAGHLLSMRAALGLVLALLAARAGAAPPEPTLRFARSGAEPRTLTASSLTAACGDKTVAVADPYYGKAKRFRAWPLRCVLEQGLGTLPPDFAGQDVLLRALDGYTRATEGAVLLEPGGYVAFADADRPGGGFDPIDYRQADPAPFYMVWQGAGEKDAARYPWPYQLAEIELRSEEH